MTFRLTTLVLVVIFQALSFVVFEFTTNEATRGVRRELFAPLELDGVLFGLVAFIIVMLVAAAVHRRPSLFRISVGLLLLFLGSIALLLPARAIAWQKPRRDRCAANLRAISAALQRYRSEHGRYPPTYEAAPDGKPMHSWRVLLLPYLGYKDLYDRYDFREPWNGPDNMKLANLRPEVFRCPSSRFDSDHLSETHYLAVTGKGTAWSLNLGPDSDKALDLGKYILLTETAEKDRCWLDPRDFDVPLAVTNNGNLETISLTSNHFSDVLVASAEGTAWAVPKETSVSAISTGLSIDDSDKWDWRECSRFIRACDPFWGTLITYAVFPLWFVCVVFLLHRSRRSGIAAALAKGAMPATASNP